MSIIEMLPNDLKQRIEVIPNPENFIIQTLRDAMDKYFQQNNVRTIRGKYKTVSTSSVEFSIKKQSEIELER